MIGLLSPALAVCLLLYLGYRYYSPFGGHQDKARKHRAASSANHNGKKYINYMPTPMNMDAVALRSLLHDQFTRAVGRRPAERLAVATPVFTAMPHGKDAAVTWLGHSSVLVTMCGKNILFDPVFSNAASPFQFAGPKRFPGSLVITPEALPDIDVVVISHDHYDHLDYHTVRKLAARVPRFFVPLGVGAHLERWGVAAEQITELDWWESGVLDGITFTCAPSRHFSGRRLNDRYATLWASWVIHTDSTKIFFSGDTGYGMHFKEIGKRFKSFDLALMECGQYDDRWPTIHMQPEETAKACAELRSKRMMPMHWGAFQLAFHDWTDSVERVLKAATAHGLEVVTPRLGETFMAKDAKYPHAAWWR